MLTKGNTEYLMQHVEVACNRTTTKSITFSLPTSTLDCSRTSLSNTQEFIYSDCGSGCIPAESKDSGPETERKCRTKSKQVQHEEDRPGQARRDKTRQDLVFVQLGWLKPEIETESERGRESLMI